MSYASRYTCPETQCRVGGRLLKDSQDVLSPPIVEEPVVECSSVARVIGYRPHASVELFVNGISMGILPGDDPRGVTFDVSDALGRALEPTDELTARQFFGTSASRPSDPVVVVSVLEAFPDGIPRPVIDPVPYYECGLGAGAADLVPGARLRMFQEHFAIPPRPRDFLGAVDTPFPAITFESAVPASLGARITADATTCGVQRTAVRPETVIAAPNPLDAPHYADGPYEGQEWIEVSRVHFGALVRVFVNGAEVNAQPGLAHLDVRQLFSVPEPLAAGDVVAISQELCLSGQPLRQRTVRACDEMPAPRVHPPGVGDEEVEVEVSVPGATIRVYADGEEIGDGGGRRIALLRPIRAGEEIIVVQQAGACTSQFRQLVTAACAPVRRVADPSPGGRFAVGSLDYEAGTFDAGLTTVPIRATVRFPADPHGDPDRMVAWGRRSPLVLFMHGNAPNVRRDDDFRCVDPSLVDSFLADGYVPVVDHHRGYAYMLEALARAGFIAVSIDVRGLNCWSGPSFVNEGADLMIEHLRFWERVNAGTEDPFDRMFRGRVDLGSVSIVGQSRSGTRIPVVLSRYAGDSQIVTAVMLSAPYDDDYPTEVSIPLLVIHGTQDGDFQRTPPYPYFDRGTGAVRSQQVLYGAGHFWFDTQLWEMPESTRPDLTPERHAAFFSALSRLWLDWVVRGRNARAARAVMAGDAVLLGFPDALAPSFRTSRDLVIDDFEDPPFEVNTLGGPVSTAGFVRAGTAELGGGARPDDSYRHDTVGFFGAWVETEHSITESFSPLDVTDRPFVSFRAAPPASVTLQYRFGITLRDGTEAASLFDPAAATVRPADPDPGIFFQTTQLQTVRIPVACIAADPSSGGVDLEDLRSVSLQPGLGIPQGAIAIDDIAFQE